MFILASLVLCIPLVLGRGTRGKHLTPSRFYETPYAVSYGIIHVVLHQVFPFSSFYFALGYVLTPPESDLYFCEEGYRPYQPLLHLLLHSSLQLPPGAVLDCGP